MQLYAASRPRRFRGNLASNEKQDGQGALSAPPAVVIRIYATIHAATAPQ